MLGGNMKRCLAIIVMIVMTVAVFAAEQPTPIVGDGSAVDTVKAFINLTNPETHFVRVGFSTTDVSVDVNGELSNITKVSGDGIELTVDHGTGLASNDHTNGSLYLYGLFYIDDKCGIKLSATALQGYNEGGATVANDFIGFKVTSTEKESVSLTVADTNTDSNYAVSGFFIENEAGANGVPKKHFDSIPLTIATTESVANATETTVEYKTVITATITAN